MTTLSDKFPILKNQPAGWMAFIFGLVVLLLTELQGSIELPKIITWYIGIGVGLILLSNYKLSLLIPKKALLLIVGLFILQTVGLFFSLDLINSIFGTLPRVNNSYLYFTSWLFSILLFASIPKEHSIFILRFVAWCGFIVGLFAILQNFGLAFYAGLTESVRVAVPSFLGNPNFSAMFVATTLPLLIFFYQESKEFWQKNMYLLLVGTSLVSVILLNSRGAYLATLIALIFYTLASLVAKSWKMFLFSVIVTSMFVAVAGMFLFQTRINIVQSQSQISSETANNRVLLWDLSRQFIAERPVFGTGFANYFIAFRSTDHTLLSNQEWFDDSHNLLLQTAVSNGVPSAIFLSLLILFSLYLVGKSFYQDRSANIALVLLVCLIVWIIASMFNPVPSPMWALLAILLAMSWRYSSNNLAYDMVGYKKIISVFFGIVFVLLGSCMFLSEVSLIFSKKALQNSQLEQAYLYSKISTLSNPFNYNSQINKAYLLMFMDEPEAGEKVLLNLSRQHKFSAGTQQTLANYYIEQYHLSGDNKYKQDAIVAIERMIALNPYYNFQYRTAATMAMRLQEYELMKDYSEKAIVLNSSSANSWILLAKANYELGDRKAVLYNLNEIAKIENIFQVHFAIRALKQGFELSQIAFPYKFNN